LIGQREGIGEGGLLFDHPEQVLHDRGSFWGPLSRFAAADPAAAGKALAKLRAPPIV
jgi:hypothetical protein